MFKCVANDCEQNSKIENRIEFAEFHAEYFGELAIRALIVTPVFLKKMNPNGHIHVAYKIQIARICSVAKVRHIFYFIFFISNENEQSSNKRI